MSANKRVSHLADSRRGRMSLATRCDHDPFARAPLGWLKGMRALTGCVSGKRRRSLGACGYLTGRFIKSAHIDHLSLTKRGTNNKTTQINCPPNRITPIQQHSAVASDASQPWCKVTHREWAANPVARLAVRGATSTAHAPVLRLLRISQRA